MTSNNGLADVDGTGLTLVVLPPGEPGTKAIYTPLCGSNLPEGTIVVFVIKDTVEPLDLGVGDRRFIVHEEKPDPQQNYLRLDSRRHLRKRKK